MVYCKGIKEQMEKKDFSRHKIHSTLPITICSLNPMDVPYSIEWDWVTCKKCLALKGKRRVKRVHSSSNGKSMEYRA